MFVDYLSHVLGAVYKVSGDIQPTRSFKELEVDSLSLAELSAQLEDELGVTIEEDLSADTTVGELSELLEASGAVLPA
ncbi:acyl carrier protein [Streptomyces sp. NBC_00885]|uniref:acyl carrier protein n=1 Tax=Streptomyces sp. NBC_00885 TaxID=2975857 RepID=UPI00386E0CF3|nr:acyl carrier protein [Streptomyces sp. NBC_00885]